MTENTKKKIDEYFLPESYRLEKATKNSFKYHYLVPEDTQNGVGMVHGGFSFTMIERFFKISIAAIDEEIKPELVKMSVNYIEAVLPSIKVEIEVNIEKQTKSLFFLNCKVINIESQKPLLTAQGLYSLLGSKSKF